MVTVLSKLLKEEHPQLDKEYLQNPTVNKILDDEELEALPLRSSPRQGIPFFPLFMNIILEVQANSVRKKGGGEGVRGIELERQK